MNKKIRFDFTEFKTESGKDFLLIYDTSHYESPTIVFDGTTHKPPPFTSSGNVVRVRFISDGASNFKGFSFNYKQVGEIYFLCVSSLCYLRCYSVFIMLWDSLKARVICRLDSALSVTGTSRIILHTRSLPSLRILITLAHFSTQLLHTALPLNQHTATLNRSGIQPDFPTHCLHFSKKNALKLLTLLTYMDTKQRSRTFYNLFSTILHQHVVFTDRYVSDHSVFLK